MDSGEAYADFVAQTLREEGYLRVQREDRVAKALGRVRGRRFIPFDVSFLAVTPVPQTYYVECKYKSVGRATEQDVGKFLADLEICAIGAQQGIVVTNRGYHPLAIDYAKAKGVRLYLLAPRRDERHSLLEELLGRPRHLLRQLKEQAQGRVELPARFEMV